MTEEEKEILEDAKSQTTIHSLYSDPKVVSDENGGHRIVRKVSWKKIISSSLFGFVLAWAVWCTTTIFGLDTRVSVTSNDVESIEQGLTDETQERKHSDSILHQRITKTDDFSRDQIRMLQKALHDYRMATFDKVDNAKETLINMMIKILENQEQIKEEK